MCQDISYLIIRQLEIKNLGIAFLSLVTLAKVICSAISFVDDNDLVVDGKQVLRKIQSILNIYIILYMATGGKMQEEKTKFYYWQWVRS